MCWDVYTRTDPKARKKYRCDAADTIIQVGYGEEDYTPEEWAEIEKAKAEEWKILPGTKYVKVKGIYEGEFTTFRGRPELVHICDKYGYWDDC